MEVPGVCRQSGHNSPSGGASDEPPSYSNSDCSSDGEASERGDASENHNALACQLSSAFSAVLARDLANQRQQAQQPKGGTGSASARGCDPSAAPPSVVGREKVCCVCGGVSRYTCPGCGARTCGVACVRSHKAQWHCSGERDVAKMVPLSEFTDAQFQRDFHFLEDARRVVSNCERLFPRVWRYSFHTLPPPLYALRKAAKQRGVVCQITSEGMSKRDANTSRFDRKTGTITWRCQFNFHDPDFTVATNWGNERHRLGDVLAYSWATNPPLPCFHINRKYNRASNWIGTVPGGGLGEGCAEGGSVDREGCGKKEEGGGEGSVGVESDDDSVGSDGPVSPGEVVGNGDEAPSAPLERELSDMGASESAPVCAADALLLLVRTDGAQQEGHFWSPTKLDVTPRSAEERRDRDAIVSFLSRGPVAILSRAERLGLQSKYFRLLPSVTLNEALRTLFFVNEFPVFDVVPVENVDSYTLVTEADKEKIRESFRKAPRPPNPERPPRRTRADLSPEERERFAQVPCRMFLGGCCKLAEECPYRHCEYGDIPACRGVVKFGLCEMGERCSFRHDAVAVAAGRRRAREERQQHRGNGPRARPRAERR
ncbi:HIT zinc finger [Trypanosoma vivax]|nr:HIT zinc finger [Trypanosoma vivax]